MPHAMYMDHKTRLLTFTCAFSSSLLCPACPAGPQDACSALQLCAASLRRAVADMAKMRKALEKVRKQVAKAKSTDDGAASRALAGRTNFTKVLTDQDHPVLRTFKQLMAKRPMRQVKDAEELANGTSDSSLPFIIKKGRGLSKLLVKDANLRGSLEATLQQFCKKLEAEPDSKSVLLGLALGKSKVVSTNA